MSEKEDLSWYLPAGLAMGLVIGSLVNGNNDSDNCDHNQQDVFQVDKFDENGDRYEDA